MGSADAPPPPLPPPLLLLVAALGICSLLGIGHALPQGASADTAQTLGAACSSDVDCASITQAECRSGTCQCNKSHPITNANECLKVSGLDGACSVTAQCNAIKNAICSSGKKCVCIPNHKNHKYSDGTPACLPTPEHIAETKKTPVDPVMIGILVSLVLMFLIICIVLQLFSKARFGPNRTILNSANPRLMNTSFLKGKGSAGSARGQRGSDTSLNTVPEPGHETDGVSQLTERPVRSGDPVSDVIGVVRPQTALPPLPPLRLSTAAPDARSLDAALRVGNA